MKDEWGFRITMEGLDAMDREYLEVDIAFFEANLKRTAKKDLELFVKSKDKIESLSDKFPTVLKGLKVGAGGIDSVKGFFELLTMEEFDIMRFEVTEDSGNTVLEVYFNEQYFDIWDAVRRGSRIHRMAFRNPLTSKKKLIKQFEKQIRDEYTKKFEIEEIEYE